MTRGTEPSEGRRPVMQSGQRGAVLECGCDEFMRTPSFFRVGIVGGGSRLEVNP